MSSSFEGSAAYADGTALATPALQRAIDRAATLGGGVLHVPPGIRTRRRSRA
jgi:polygalacturonase